MKYRKKLNIVMVCDPITDYIAGSYLSAQSFSEILKKRGHKIIFIAARSPANPKDNYWKGIKVYRFASIPLPKSEHKVYIGFPTVQRLKKILKDEKIDIVHAIIPTPLSVMAIKAAKSVGLKVVTHSHTQAENVLLYWPKFLFRDSLNWLFYKYLAWFYEQSDFLIHPSEFSKIFFSTLDTKTKNVVISNGVNIEKFKKTDADKPQKKTKNILFVGRLYPEKCVDTLIEAMPLILKKEPNAHLNIVGGGNLEEQLKNLSKKLGMEKHITFAGRVNEKDLVGAYNAADVFVMPSISELEGMAVLEAMACGKPIVIADAKESASKDFVSGNGLLFKPQNPKDLAHKVEKILANDGMRHRMGEESLRISKNFDIQKSVTKLEKTYYSLMKIK